MTYKEAEEKAFKSRWKATECNTPDCWCRIIEPEEKILYDLDWEFYIAPSGSVHKDFAEHIVNLHNNSLK